MKAGKTKVWADPVTKEEYEYECGTAPDLSLISAEGPVLLLLDMPARYNILRKAYAWGRHRETSTRTVSSFSESSKLKEKCRELIDSESSSGPFEASSLDDWRSLALRLALQLTRQGYLEALKSMQYQLDDVVTHMAEDNQVQNQAGKWRPQFSSWMQLIEFQQTSLRYLKGMIQRSKGTPATDCRPLHWATGNSSVTGIDVGNQELLATVEKLERNWSRITTRVN
ncbi:hypothetical protein MKZ38_000132 [Zalerion maritima]|uniref:Uncharacterized protein n=1 Tax=Zalerion maritima TaxID=339359 RepID=A0AAD5RT79_9PEZI|nr:hypothetical protein MKZ38_000132 [Zalerion maritima]